MIDSALLAHLPTAVLAFALGAFFNPKILACGLCASSRRTGSGEKLSQSSVDHESASPTADFTNQAALANAGATPIEASTADIEIAAPTLLLCERTAIEHGLALLRWLQEPGGISGEIPVSEIQLIYREMCAELAWAERSWIVVGRELRQALGQARKYANRGGQKLRVYSIPTAIRPTERIPLRRIA